MVNSDDCGDSIFLDFDRKMGKEKRYETTIPRKLIDCCKTLSNGGVVSNSDFKMKKLLLLTLFSFLPLGTENAAFFISGKEICGYGDYSYQIGPNVMFADLSVQAGPNVMFADITIQIVESPQEADLVFVDNSFLNYQSLNAVDMTICKTSMFADKSIQIGPNVMKWAINLIKKHG